MLHKLTTFPDAILDRQIQDIVNHVHKVVVPSTATSIGAVGEWAADTSYLYIYTGDGVTHSWRRVAIASW